MHYEVLLFFFNLATWTKWSNSSSGKLLAYAQPLATKWASPHRAYAHGSFTFHFSPWVRH